MDIDFFHPPAPGEARPFTRAVRAGGLVYVSGHSAPHEPTRGIHRGARIRSGNGGRITRQTEARQEDNDSRAIHFADMRSAV